MIPANAALIVVDVQQGFLEPSWGPRDNPDAETNVATLIKAWRRTGRPIHHVRHSSRSLSGSFYPGTTGHDFKPEAVPVAGEPVHVKSVNSDFIGTNLEDDLRKAGIDTVIVVELTTNHCVSTTVRMAAKLGFETSVVEDATATFDRIALDGRIRPAVEVHAAALSDFAGEFASVASTADIIRQLEMARPKNGMTPSDPGPRDRRTGQRAPADSGQALGQASRPSRRGPRQATRTLRRAARQTGQ